MNNDPKIHLLIDCDKPKDILPCVIVRFQLFGKKYTDIAINIDGLIREFFKIYPKEMDKIIERIKNAQKI